MKTVKVTIDIPFGYEVDKENSTLENITLKKVDSNSDKEKLFLELFQGLEIKSNIEEFPDKVFYLKDGKVMLEIEKSNLWISYEHIWSKFSNEFNMQDSDIQKFIKEMVEKHFKWKELTPINTVPNNSYRWKSISNGRN